MMGGGGRTIESIVAGVEVGFGLDLDLVSESGQAKLAVFDRSRSDR